MTVESILTKRIYQANGDTREWPVPFAYSRTDDLCLILTSADGRETPITSNYRVNVNEAGDTSVTYPLTGPPLSAGNKLTVYRDTPKTQVVDLEYGGAFMPDVLEKDGLDRLEMQIQEIQEEVDRALMVPISSGQTGSDLLNDIYGARDETRAEAGEAAKWADAAKASAALANEERDKACKCAALAEEARDVAIEQAEANNLLMETELHKVNVIVADNREAQQASMETARKWAEADGPVRQDEDGTVHYSAKYWAGRADENSQAIHEVTQAEYNALTAAGTLSPGAEYVITDGVNAGSLIVIGQGGSRHLIKSPGTFVGVLYFYSGTTNWVVPDLNGDGTPWLAFIRLKGGGCGGHSSFTSSGPYRHGGAGGGEGCLVERYIHLTPGDTHVLTVGAGGAGAPINGNPSPGNTTSFGTVEFAPGATDIKNSTGGSRTTSTHVLRVIIGAPGSGRTTSLTLNSHSDAGSGGGAGGGGSGEGSDGVFGGGGSAGYTQFNGPGYPGQRGGTGFIEISKVGS